MNRCPGCTSDYCPIESDGPLDARVYCYGERPGQQEQAAALYDLRNRHTRERRCFIGQAGDEWNLNYLYKAGLRREEVHCGNVVLCGQANNKAPSEGEIRQCAEYHVRPEIEQGQPEVLVLMGASACLLAGDIDLEADQGIPFYGKLWDWEGWIVPMYHPALGLHKTIMMKDIMEAWETLGKWLKTGEWQWPLDTHEKDYRLARTPEEVWDYFHDYDRAGWLLWAGTDTERHGRLDFSIQVSIEPHTGIMVLEEDSEAIYQLGRSLDPYTLIYHYAPADDARMRRLGLTNPYRDTHIEAYNLGLPQALKALAKRLLGRSRPDWEHTVGKVSKEKLCGWLFEALEIARDEWSISEPRFHKTTHKPITPKRTSHPAEKAISHVLRYTLSSAKYSAWEKIIEFGGEIWQEPMEAKLGPMPIKGIGNCSLPVARDYGCSDADDTLRIAFLMEDLRRQFGEKIRIQDADKDVLV
jgi:uracil-DNA glycosylase family 4